MGTAKILFNNRLSMLCQRGDSLDDRETADALLKEVMRQQGTDNHFIQCENGGGFNANDVIGVTIPQAVEGTTEAPE